MAGKGKTIARMTELFFDKIGNRLFGEGAEQKAKDLLVATKEGGNEMLSGGESVASADPLAVPTAGEIAQKAAANKAPIRSATEETYRKIIKERVETKLNQMTPDIFKAVKEASGGNTSLATALSNRAQKMGIPLTPEHFVMKNASPEQTMMFIKGDVLRSHMETLSYMKMADEMYGQLSHLVEPEGARRTLGRALQKAGIKYPKGEAFEDMTKRLRSAGPAASRKVTTELFTTLSAARALQMNAVEGKILNVSTIEKLTLTFPDMVARTYSWAARNNMPELANISEKLYLHANNLDRLAARVNSIHGGLSGEWKALTEKGLDTKVRQYIQTMRPEEANSKSFFRSSDLMDDGLAIDKEAAVTAGLMDAAGNPLVERSVFETAIRTQNSLRVTRRMENNLEAGISDEPEDNLPQMWSDLVNSEIPMVRGGQKTTFSRKYGWVGENMSGGALDGYGDVGHNYFPIRITEEHAAKIKDKRTALGYGDDARDAQYGYQRMRKIDSQAQIDENRLSPLEELDNYFGQYMYSVMSRVGRGHIADMRKVIRVYDPMGVTDRKTSKELEALVDDMDKFYQNMFRGAPDPYEKNAITAVIAGLTDINTAVLMSPLNPRMMVFNTVQDWQTSAMWKPFYSVLKAQKMYKDIAKIYIGGEPGLYKLMGKHGDAELKKALVKSIPNPEFKDVVKYYFDTRMPDALAMDVYEGTPKIQEALRWIGGMYQATDILSRGKSLYAAWDFGAKEYEKILGNAPKDAIDMSKAKRDLTKALHLHEFNELDINRLMRRMGNRQEFLNEYAALSTHYEMFNYSRFNKAYIADMARTGHPVFSRAVRFLSWNTYYLNMIKGAYRSYQDGDKTPLRKLGALSIIWWGTAAAASGMDNEYVQSWATYGLGRVPFWSPVMGLTTQGFNQTYGIAAPSIATMLYPIIKSVDAMTDWAAGTSENEMDRIEEVAFKQMRYQPLIRVPEKVLEFMGDITGISEEK